MSDHPFIMKLNSSFQSRNRLFLVVRTIPLFLYYHTMGLFSRRNAQPADLPLLVARLPTGWRTHVPPLQAQAFSRAVGTVLYCRDCSRLGVPPSQMRRHCL